MTKTKAWINAFRLRTLPLSVSGVLAGSFIALSRHYFDWIIFSLAIVTTLFLQILSNLANDYGDTKNGKDNADRLGPLRMVQSGIISLKEMKVMIVIFSLLSLISGVSLILISHIEVFSASFFVLLGLGLIAIWAALTYTIGNNPYGYSGWGDISVFIFFGLFSVAGTTFLYNGSITPDIFLPAIAVGSFSVGVLNLNNMRDYISDKNSGKITMVVKMGPQKAKVYHTFLLVVPVVASILYLLINKNYGGYISLIVLIPIVLHSRRISRIKDPALFDLELKKLALTALLFSIVFGIGINL